MSLMAGVRIPELLGKQVSIIPALEGEMRGNNKRLSRKFMGQLAWQAQCKQERLSQTRGLQGLVPEAGLDTPHTRASCRCMLCSFNKGGGARTGT